MRKLALVIVATIPFYALCQRSIDTTEVVTVNGLHQFISLKGSDTSNPVLLFLHGGPGNSVMGYAHKFTSRLEKHFVVVMWDQREAGKTLELNRSNVPLSLNVFDDDTHALIAFLLQRFRQQKLFLAGHSWGTVPGFNMAARHPELLHAYIAISPVINQLESERIALVKMKEKAELENDQAAMRELSSVDIPFNTAEDIFFHRKWLLHFNGQRNDEQRFPKNYVEKWAATWLKVWNEASAINRFETLPSIGCPVYFVTGDKDYQTNAAITEEYFNKVSAPVKQFFKFPDTGHSVPSARGQMLQDVLIGKILPEAFPQSKSVKVATH